MTRHPERWIRWSGKKSGPLRDLVKADSMVQLALAVPAGCFVGLGDRVSAGSPLSYEVDRGGGHAAGSGGRIYSDIQLPLALD
jgi:hypothetical protein